MKAITWVVAAAGIMAVLGAAAPPPVADGTAWPGSPNAVKAVGRLYAHFPGLPVSEIVECSAAVVASRGGDVISTAGHCVFHKAYGGWATSIDFAPGYHDGQRPYGTFHGRQAFTTRGWLSGEEQARDVAFVALAPDAHGKQVRDAVGAGFGVSFSQRPGPVTALGFPAAPPYDGEHLAYCRNTAVAEPSSGGGLTLPHCRFTEGASGGPWLRGIDAVSGGGVQVGVDADAWSDANNRPLNAVYSPAFGPDAHGAFNAAQRA